MCNSLAVRPIAVRILHREAPRAARPLERALADASRANGDRLVSTFRELGVQDACLIAGPPDGASFGGRLRSIAAALPTDAGLIVAGSGAAAAADTADLVPFLRAAGADTPSALANNRYSADLVAVAPAILLREVPDLGADNALPRWLEEAKGTDVRDRRRRWRLQVDIDSPADALVLGMPVDVDAAPVRAALDRVARIAFDRRAEVVIAGRTSAATLRWAERAWPARVRALIEERGLRAAWTPGPDGQQRRPPRSVLGLVLDRDGPESLGDRLAELGDAAIIDTRVLLAHRLGSDDASWPSREDRFASDLLLVERIRDPWLHALTDSARSAPIPVALGGHTLVGPGLRLAVPGPLVP